MLSCLGYSVLDAGLSCTKGVWYIYAWDTGSSILIELPTGSSSYVVYSLIIKQVSHPSCARRHGQVLEC